MKYDEVIINARKQAEAIINKGSEPVMMKTGDEIHMMASGAGLFAANKKRKTKRS